MNADDATQPLSSGVNFEKATLLWSLPWDADWISAVSFVGANHIAAGNNLGEIFLWELPEKPEPAPEPADKSKSSSGDKSERPIYSAPLPSRQFTGHSNVINRLLCAENRWLISASNDHTLRYWDLQATPGAPAKLVLNARTIEDIARNKSSGRKSPPPLEVEVRTQPATKTIQGSEWFWRRVACALPLQVAAAIFCRNFCCARCPRSCAR